MRITVLVIYTILVAVACDDAVCPKGTTEIDGHCIKEQRTDQVGIAGVGNDVSGAVGAGAAGAGIAGLGASPELVGAAGSSASESGHGEAGLGSAGSSLAGGAPGSSSVPVSTCGNGIREGAELCDGADCPTCVTPDKCLVVKLEGSSSTCDARCGSVIEIIECKSGDGCCARGCKSPEDADCSKSCGDGIVDAPELCEPTSKDKPCPTACADNDPCTKDLMTGTPEQCNVVCSHMAITSYARGDGCCPRGANIGNDDDCDSACGDGVVSDGETCDPKSSSMPCPSSCDDGNECTRDALIGDVDKCSATCMNAAIGLGVQNACRGCNKLDHPPGTPCSVGSGACAGRGTYECQGRDATVCNAEPIVVSESCDGADNDCDGKTDEGVKNACGGCGNVPVEICDRADNDCDGKTDEGVKNACGSCGNVPAETCDGQDNDCDGKSDEGVRNACGGCGNVPAETCDGQDNDCDGKTDEGVRNACGGCVALANAVRSSCRIVKDTCSADGLWMCNGVDALQCVTQGTGSEICDGQDNDCDNFIDETACSF